MPQLYDNHGRPLTYLRLAVTDRCNLRCFYCMPEHGIQYLPKQQLLTYEEMLRLVELLSEMGIRKVRITGGEPFVRKDLVPFMHRLAALPQLDILTLTTNGVLTQPHIPALVEMGVTSVNLSLDTLDRQRFHHITRRDEFDKVMATYHALLEHQIQVKMNVVVMEGKNEEDILPMVALTKEAPVEVRFIEEMPFNGTGEHYPKLRWTHQRILAHIRTQYPHIIPEPFSAGETAQRYHIEGHQGTVGIIAAFSRTFCGSCNRIRITAKGTLKTCLYDNGVLDIKTLMRSGATDETLKAAFLQAFRSRAKDGFEAEKATHAPKESMSEIGG